MTITIYEGIDNSYVILKSKDERFTSHYGTNFKVHVCQLFKTMEEMATYINNKLNEECLFEVE